MKAGLVFVLIVFSFLDQVSFNFMASYLLKAAPLAVQVAIFFKFI